MHDWTKNYRGTDERIANIKRNNIASDYIATYM